MTRQKYRAGGVSYHSPPHHESIEKESFYTLSRDANVYIYQMFCTSTYTIPYIQDKPLPTYRGWQITLMPPLVVREMPAVILILNPGSVSKRMRMSSLQIRMPLSICARVLPMQVRDP